MMGKRGQATLFIILGVILVLVVALYFVGVQTEIIPPLIGASDASSEMNDIETHVEGCLEEIGEDYLYILGMQGGYLNPAEDTYRLYNDSSVSYLCWNQVDYKTCTNRLLTLNKMEEDLTDAIQTGLETCINVYDYSNDVEAGEWEVEVDVNFASVDLELYYPVTVDQGDGDVVSQDEFDVTLDVPLGELYEVSQDIVNEHATIGDFDQLLYMLSKLSRYTIYKNKPYPDVIYQVKLREGDYIFQFAIEGESNV